MIPTTDEKTSPAPVFRCEDCGTKLTIPWVSLRGVGPICDHCLALRVQAVAGEIQALTDDLVTILPPMAWITVADLEREDTVWLVAGYRFEYPHLSKGNAIHYRRILAVQQDDSGIWLWLDNGAGWPTRDNRIKVSPDERLRVTNRVEFFPTRWMIKSDPHGFHFRAVISADLGLITPAAHLDVYRRDTLSPYASRVNWGGNSGDSDFVQAFSGVLAVAANLASNMERVWNFDLDIQAKVQGK